MPLHVLHAVDDDDVVVVLCTAPAAAGEAERLARGLVDARLAACVNVIAGVRSFYRWKGAIEEDAEVQLVVKTRGQRLPEIAAWLDEHHPYDVPEVLAWPVAAGAPAYLQWVHGQTSEGAAQ